MYFIRILFLNILRQKKYALSLFISMTVVCMAITMVIGIHMESASSIQEISERYTTAVTPIYYPLKSQTNKTQKNGHLQLTKNDIADWIQCEEVAQYSYIKACPFSVYLWQFIYTEDSFQNDIVITDHDWMQRIYAQGVRSSEFCDSIVLVDGEPIGNSINSDQTIPMLISDDLADRLGVKVHDILTISHASNLSMPSDQFVVNGIFQSNIDSEKNLIYLPEEITDAYLCALGLEEEEDSYLDYLFDVKFILRHPDDADAFISKAYQAFQEIGYVLQADDYAYKKEIYPLQMMHRLNNIIGTCVISLGILLLLLITLQSIRVRNREYTVFKLLSPGRRTFLFLYIAEKAILLILSSFFGVFLGTGLLSLLFSRTVYAGIPYALCLSAVLTMLVLFICFFIYFLKFQRPLMGDISNGK